MKYVTEINDEIKFNDKLDLSVCPKVYADFILGLPLRGVRALKLKKLTGEDVDIMSFEPPNLCDLRSEQVESFVSFLLKQSEDDIIDFIFFIMDNFTALSCDTDEQVQNYSHSKSMEEALFFVNFLARQELNKYREIAFKRINDELDNE